METVRETNELTDEPQEISLIIKDCADGSIDEDHAQKWLEKVKESIVVCKELLKITGE